MASKICKWDIFAVVYEISLGFKHQTEASRGNFLMGRMCICEHDNGNQALCCHLGLNFPSTPGVAQKLLAWEPESHHATARTDGIT